MFSRLPSALSRSLSLSSAAASASAIPAAVARSRSYTSFSPFVSDFFVYRRRPSISTEFINSVNSVFGAPELARKAEKASSEVKQGSAAKNSAASESSEEIPVESTNSAVTTNAIGNESESAALKATESSASTETASHSKHEESNQPKSSGSSGEPQTSSKNSSSVARRNSSSSASLFPSPFDSLFAPFTPFNQLWSNFYSDGHGDIRVEMNENDKEFQIIAHVPGFNKENLKLRNRNGVLTITGQAVEEKRTDNGSYSRSSYFANSSVPLPENADESNINAKFENGKLNIHVGKLEKPKKNKTQIAIE